MKERDRRCRLLILYAAGLESDETRFLICFKIFIFIFMLFIGFGHFFLMWIHISAHSQKPQTEDMSVMPKLSGDKFDADHINCFPLLPKVHRSIETD